MCTLTWGTPSALRCAVVGLSRALSGEALPATGSDTSPGLRGLRPRPRSCPLCVLLITRCLPARWGRPWQAGTPGPSPSPWCPQESLPARGRPREGQGPTLGLTVSLSRAGSPKKTPGPSRSHLLLGPKEAQGWGSDIMATLAEGTRGLCPLLLPRAWGQGHPVSLLPLPPREGCSQDKNTLGNIPWCLA